MILVDTSVWVDHLRYGDSDLARLLQGGVAACHPFVIGELACGIIPNRDAVLALLSALPALTKAEDEEVLAFVDRHSLMGKGLGLVGIHLLASCMLENVPLWTRDKALAQTASSLGLAEAP